MSKYLSVLGATGSIGDSVLDLVASHPDRFRVHALSAQTQIGKLASLARKFKPKILVVPDQAGAQKLSQLIDGADFAPEILIGQSGLIEAATAPEADAVVCAIVGIAGLPSAYAAASHGKRVLLANKESLVAAGPLFMKAAQESGADILPLDSEHNAIFQCLPKPIRHQEIDRIILTASGGPFRTLSLKDLSDITPEQACAHPKWTMGRKISVDSATMLNKGLEVIEAKWLFNLDPAQISVLIHPQSTVHSLVQYQDGSLLAQLGHADMRIPISYAMAFPERITNNCRRFSLEDLCRLDFYPPDFQRFEGLKLAYDALEAGCSHCIILNAVNEAAVEAFLHKRIGFLDITGFIKRALDAHSSRELNSIEEVIALDQEAKALAAGWLTT